jgi:ABC transporter substrate binding protein
LQPRSIPCAASSGHSDSSFPTCSLHGTRWLAARIREFAGSATTFGSRIAAFRQGLREHGYTDESLFIEPRWADGKEELLPVLAAEIIGLKVALLVTVGTPASLAPKQVTETVPIVMIAVGDPVGPGLAKSLARPGGNFTGVSNLAADVTPSYSIS